MSKKYLLHVFLQRVQHVGYPRAPCEMTSGNHCSLVGPHNCLGADLLGQEHSEKPFTGSLQKPSRVQSYFTSEITEHSSQDEGEPNNPSHPSQVPMATP